GLVGVLLLVGFVLELIGGARRGLLRPRLLRLEAWIEGGVLSHVFVEVAGVHALDLLAHRERLAAVSARRLLARLLMELLRVARRRRRRLGLGWRRHRVRLLAVLGLLRLRGLAIVVGALPLAGRGRRRAARALVRRAAVVVAVVLTGRLRLRRARV